MSVTLDTYIAFKPLSRIDDDEEIIVGYLQRGFEYISNMLRIDLSIHPLRFQKHTILGGFEYPGIIQGSLSEISFKFIKKYCMCNISSVVPDDMQEITDSTIGNVTEVDYTYLTFDEVNDDQEVTPEITIMGHHIHCTNLDDSMIILAGYPYPYLCTTNDGQYIDRHLYDIQDMIDIYGSANLNVEPTIGLLTMMAALMFWYHDNLRIQEFTALKKLMQIIVNIHNSNKATLDISIYSNISLLDGSESLDVNI